MAKFGDGMSVPNQGGMASAPTSKPKPDSGKPGGTPTGSTPGLGGRKEGMRPKPVGGSGKTVSSPKPFKGGSVC